MLIKPLLKTLTEAGVGSRRRMTDAIQKGRVEINGIVAEGFNQPVNLDKDTITIDSEVVDLKPETIICLMIHKPKGLLSTTSDEKGRRTVLDILPGQYRQLRLYPAGRLDKDSTGLLLLTNDGRLTYRLTHPKFKHEKEYLVHIDGRLQSEEIRKLERGIKLEDGMTQPATIKAVMDVPPYNYSITIHEGKKRQIRRMFDSLSHHVLALKRIRIGNVNLGSLKEGDTRRLRPKEITSLIDN